MFRRGLTLFSLLAALLAGLVVPAGTADAAVYSTCTMTRCADGKTAYNGWKQLGFPTASGWYAWPYGRYNYTGGRFQNREGQLPAGDVFYEYDVYPRNRGAARDAYRIVRDATTGVVWFSPDHYANFYRIV